MEGKDLQVCLRRHSTGLSCAGRGLPVAVGMRGHEVDPRKPAAFRRILAE